MLPLQWLQQWLRGSQSRVLPGQLLARQVSVKYKGIIRLGSIHHENLKKCIWN